MEVLYWASIISISILATFVVRYLFQRKSQGKVERLVSIAPKASIAGWLVWTLVMLSGPLLIFQLGLIAVVGIAGFVLFWYVTTRDRKVDYLEAALRDASKLKNANFNEAIIRENAQRTAEADAISKIYPIDGVTNLKSELDSALATAKERILIMSGWASSYVIDDAFIQNCMTLLSSGTEVHLGFGYNSSSDRRKPEWEKRGRQQVGNLMTRALEEKVDHNLYIYEFDNHYKSLVKDSDYFLVGSINWLSNSRGKNFERAWKNEFPELAQKEFDDCLRIMRPKKLILRRKILKPFFDWSDG